MTNFDSPLLVLGAGASAAFGVPTMAGFLEDQWRIFDQSLAGSIAVRRSLELHEVADLEEVMYLLERFASMEREDAGAALLLERVHAKFGNLKDFTLDRVRKEANEEREKLRQIIYRKCTSYDAVKAHDTYVTLFHSLVEYTQADRIRIATTNYDRIIEELWERPKAPLHELSPSLELQSGFYSPGYGNRRLDPSRGYPQPGEDTDTVIHLIKLHGSLDWREYEPGRVEETGAREYPGEYSVLAYPIRSDKSLEPPFSLLYEAFDDALSQSNLIVIVGMSLRDIAIVGRLADTLRTGKKLAVIVDPEPEAVRNRFPQAVRQNVATVDGHFGASFPPTSVDRWNELVEEAIAKTVMEQS